MPEPLHEFASTFSHLQSSTDAADRTFYGRDLWPRHHLDVRRGRVAEHKPAAIVWPESQADVVALVLWAGERGVPLVPFGAGSGVCAGILPSPDAVVVDLKKMHRVRRLDRDAPLVEVEAGAMGLPFEEELGRRGFTLGHFPSSILCSTVGGWIAARSAGQASGRYGKIEDMVVSIEAVTGAGEPIVLPRRTRGPDLAAWATGSEGTMAIITAATLRLHPAPKVRGFGAWSFPSTEAGWEAMRAIFQAGLRPAVLRLYDPFDAMLARMGAVKKPTTASSDGRAAKPHTPGLGAKALRAILTQPHLFNELLDSRAAAKAMGGALVVAVFDGVEDEALLDLDAAKALLATRGEAKFEGEGPARRWFQHRYSISYRQAPTIASGLFLDTMEIATTWSNLGALYEAVRRALGEQAFVMAHLSHAYPDGCCIYFSFAGHGGGAKGGDGWDEACLEAYDATWKRALAAAEGAGGTIAHHHGAGRSKAPRLSSELGAAGIHVVRAMQRAFDPKGILNPGNLAPRTEPRASAPAATEPRPARLPIEVDPVSLLVEVDGAVTLDELERTLSARGTTLDVSPLEGTVAQWLAEGAPGGASPWSDPADHAVAGMTMQLTNGEVLHVRAAPRRAVGPDLVQLACGMEGRFGVVTRATLRIHPVGTSARSLPFDAPREPRLSPEEEAVLGRLEVALLEVLSLPEDEQLEIASEILASVDGPPDAAWEAAWLGELDRRVAAARNAGETGADWTDARSRILKRLGRT